MKEEFLSKLNTKEYISQYLYNNVLNNCKEIIPSNFNIDTYNNDILNNKCIIYKDYFNNLYKDINNFIHLDTEQIKSILSDEKYTLIIAGAGTGKTTTMVAKVKYLVDIKKVDPRKILVMSYTKKSTQELENRLVYDFNIPVDIETFHSLGYKIVRNIYKNHFPYVVDNNIRNDIFLKYFKEKIFVNKNKISELIELFDNSNTFNDSWIITKYFKENYSKYKTFDEYFDDYKLNKIKNALNSVEGIEKTIERIIDKDLNNELIRTIKNELVKSKGEAEIANFLFCNNIEYHYEKVYEEILPDYKIYKPDFTLELNGEKVYIEYFGLSNYEDENNKTYQKIKKLKEDYHIKHHNKFIKIDYAKGEDLIKTLELELLKMGFKLNPITNEEIYSALIERNKLSEIFKLKDNFYDIIDTIKSSINRNNMKTIVEEYFESLDDETRKYQYRQYLFLMDFYNYYQKELYGKSNYGFDYSDMIYYAKTGFNYLDTNILNYDYIIIDEYQDISSERYELTDKIINKNNSKLVVVGDDWQTIYSFSGSKIQYIYNFSKYFPNSKMFTINKTYRNSQELVQYAGKFIMKNDNQIKKELISEKVLNQPVVFVPFDNYFETEELKKLIINIYNNNKDHNILILSRTNKTIENLFNDKFFIDDIGTKVKIQSFNDLNVEAMSIHKSKGLTSDEVIIIGLDKNFPIQERNKFWLKNLFVDENAIEAIKDAEERRVFYVALTRTKKHVYLLTNRESKYRSPFIEELYRIINN